MVIACDHGRITIQDGAMKVDRLRDSIRSRTASASEFFGEIENQVVAEQGHDRLRAGAPGAHVHERRLAIADREALTVTAKEAAAVVEVVNAIVLSAAAGAS